ncbi:PhoX family phosphatase [Neptunomonas sp. CHC150]|uniref:PhoX family protein n=1 Tax=Neptunomonas sp. CHC150 TaxID=2998324 RepID=UPI0025B19EFD|nr:PhoX family phosphatase [Neptunomonas sp. CHC150]MDN2659847.1 PhoX family phosphatase [Neptunomonas sp. CHC150]
MNPNDVNAQPTDSIETTDFDTLVDKAISRRSLLKGAMATGIVGFFTLSPMAKAVADTMASSKLIGFEGIPASTEDAIKLPQGYRHTVLMAWGDPVLPGAPAFDHSGKQTAKDQAMQFGDNTDGMTLFHLKDEAGNIIPDRAVLAVNNEYTNNKIVISADETGSAEDVAKLQAAHGVTIVELKRDSNHQWHYVKDSKMNRRLHANSEFEITGPAAGHDLLKTMADKTGTKALGTINNCANGQTPWETYLTCEENFHNYFGASDAEKLPAELAEFYGAKADESKNKWWKYDDRFDLAKNPNEANRFGWVVEIDPFDPTSTPKKRTALGRIKHENAEVVVNGDGHIVVYMGDDERGEHIYRFVSKNKYQPNNPSANRDLLDEGTLYVAKFNGELGEHDGKGEWIALVHGQNGLTKENGFADQASILVNTRKAAKHVKATTMDRPEWITHNPSTGQVFCTLTNNKHRGNKENQPLNAANPRQSNHYGQIIRWSAAGNDHTADTFVWDLFLLAGNPTVHPDTLYAGSKNITADNMFNSPDGIGFDKGGRLWVLTDGDMSNEGDFAGQGNNQMLCADPSTAEIRRFLVGPVGCEVTGLTFADDNRAMFVGIQHPTKGFPDYLDGGKPRSSILVITREDGGVIGA